MQRLLRLSALVLCLLAGTAVSAPFLGSLLEDRSPDPFTVFVRTKRDQPLIDYDRRWRLFTGGDVMLSRFVAELMKRSGSPDWPWEGISDHMKSADIAFVNLENPVVEGLPMPTDGMIFRMDPSALAGMKNAGIDVVSLANNHQSDVGREYIQTTANNVAGYGIVPVGSGMNAEEAHRFRLLQAPGATVAFLAYGDPRFSGQVHFATEDKPGIALADAERMKTDVAHAREQADVVIISLHAGIEYRDEPDTFQRTLLEAAADAGADLVIGHHPHVVQPLWQHNGTWIASSLGNLVFDQNWSAETQRGMTLGVEFDGTMITQIEAIPVSLEGTRPVIAEGNAGMETTDRLQTRNGQAVVLSWDGESATTSMRALPLQRRPSPSFTITRTLTGDLDNDGTTELYALKNGLLTAREHNRVFWSSPDDLWVQDFTLADIDGNGHDELVMSVWKSGDYGSSKPFWVEENDDSVRNHLFVYTLDERRVMPLWQSSNLSQPNCEMLMKDLDGDGIDELAVLEGSYADDGSCTASRVAVWKWNDWGFFHEWRSPLGLYWDLRVERSGSGHVLIVNQGSR